MPGQHQVPGGHHPGQTGGHPGHGGEVTLIITCGHGDLLYIATQEKCLILEAIRTVEERCHGKESCSVQASPETLASGLRDPCPTVRSADSQRNTVMIIMSFVGSMWRCCTSVSPCHSGLAWCAGENTCPCHAPHPPQGILTVLDPDAKIRLKILNITGWLCSLPHSPPRAVVTCSALCHVGDTCLASDTCQGPLVTTA